MEANQGDHGKNYRAEEDLSNVIVENLLIGSRGIDGLRFFLARCLNVEEGVYWGGYVLFYVHVIAPFYCDTGLFLRSAYSWGSSLISEGRSVYNKGSSSLQLLFAKFCGFLPKMKN
jgi:hypothetical protein